MYKTLKNWIAVITTMTLTIHGATVLADAENPFERPTAFQTGASYAEESQNLAENIAQKQTTAEFKNTEQTFTEQNFTEQNFTEETITEETITEEMQPGSTRPEEDIVPAPGTPYFPVAPNPAHQDRSGTGDNTSDAQNFSQEENPVPEHIQNLEDLSEPIVDFLAEEPGEIGKKYYGSYNNPMYPQYSTDDEWALEEEWLIEEGELGEADTANASVDPVVYTTHADVAVAVREKMVAREEKITVLMNSSLKSYFIGPQITGDVTAYQKFLDERVFAHTGNPQEGDYLKAHIVGTNMEAWDRDGIFDLTIIPKYFSDASMEEKVDQEIRRIFSTLNLTGKSDLQKIESVYLYMVKNIK